MIEPSPEHDRLAHEAVQAAFAVHTTLGPGLLESAYQQCLGYELEARGIPFERQVVLRLCYKGRPVEAGDRMDMVVDGLVVIEIKAVEKLLPVHDAQLDTYLKLSGHQLGLLMNFNVALIKHGLRRRIRSH